MTLTPKARAALTRIANGDGDATQHTRQMISALSRNKLIDFNLEMFRYVITDRGRDALAGKVTA